MEQERKEVSTPHKCESEGCECITKKKFCVRHRPQCDIHKCGIEGCEQSTARAVCKQHMPTCTVEGCKVRTYDGVCYGHRPRAGANRKRAVCEHPGCERTTAVGMCYRHSATAIGKRRVRAKERYAAANNIAAVVGEMESAVLAI